MNMLRLRWLLPVALIVIVAAAFNELRPVGAVGATQSLPQPPSVPGTAQPVPWPSGAQGAIGAGDGVIAVSPGARPQPIASVAKVMMALAVLEAKPLQKGQDGPAVPVTADDVNEYQADKAATQSVVAVAAGEQLSELQALQALLIPSGNNIASLLARWAYGSVDAAVQHLNEKAAGLGLTHTRFADVSGFSPQTVSEPADLVRLGEIAMQDPVLSGIVGTGQVTLPVAGTSPNVNYALGQDGIIGVKTGNIPEGGAIYLFAASGALAGGRQVTLVGAVQGLSTLDLAFSAARTLLRAARASLVVEHVVSRNQTVGRYTLPWGGGTDIVATEDLDLLAWPGTVVRVQLRTAAVEPPVSPQTQVGRLHVTAGDGFYDVPVATTDQLYGPGRLARLTRITW
jgi:D-alanyl-D-alanine carboxypeptidase (penicillin-binding protein 5/6)